ncbi:MAG TPA: PEP-CTERM sorting domain-containing protein [Bryobacteraceae bacterium]|nr:PEP-CTERM sorting domain-containing protein [Bryobacteraceae bacterium]
MKRILWGFAPAALMLTLSGVAPAAPIIIDDFSTPSSGQGAFPGTGILAGERDVITGGSSTFTAGSGSGTAALGTGLTSTFVLLDYDGLDGSTATVFLLGGLDITNGGLLDRFQIEITAVTGTVRTTVRVAEDLQTADDYTERWIDISSAGTYEILFSSFSPAANVDFESVERMFLRFNLDAEESITVSGFSIVGDPNAGNGNGNGNGPAPIPEPSTVALLGLGLAAVEVVRRRRQSA